MYFAYVQKNLKQKLYKGHTSNITRRRVEHLLGWSPYSKRFGPSKIVYFEIFKSRSKAMQREKYFKTGAGRNYLKKLLT
ncbi:GIY-YIG nuclease family protein [Patescibacteria group bacterium]|nr:GIY-YIG nuclease family protein [Patescibacteria group bacterium]MBU1682384.1 GIY-YIG nuclease family protein [Patescibacteria group bacterium]MBU1935044.1 GIY-YIG nuclease family protein [Patescibacteria group bacterium]